QEFGKNVIGVDDDVLDYLMAYNWPGNIRELRNLIERAMNIVDGETIQMNHLQLNVFNVKNHQDTDRPDTARLISLANVNRHKSLRKYLNDIEKEIISDCLIECDG